MRTVRAPLARQPAVLVGGWAAFVALGIVVALAAQSWVVAAKQLQVDHVLPASVLGILAGAVGAKLWYVLLHRRDGRRGGWCIQGLVAGVVIAAPALLALLHTSVGTYLDATAPALMLGFAVGRIGCLVGGCCYGRCTASPWAVLSSDRRVARRRIPTQLLESALALGIALGALTGVLVAGAGSGGIFVAALAAYTFGRQGILRLRAEPRTSRLAGPAAAAVAAAVLVAETVALTLISR